ncbi:MAG: RICIN domain-containing protein [Prolixibacteraceae bacterium]
MRKRYLSLLILFFFLIGNVRIQAQNTIPADDVSSASDHLTAFPYADRTLSFSVSDSGVYKPINWGLDLAWLSESNIRRGIAFMGAERVDIVRSSFMPTNPLLNGELQGLALTNTNLRLDIIRKWLPQKTQVVLNSDHPSVHSYYKGNAENWAALIDVTTRMHQEAGRVVTTVSPFNEPDYSATGQGTIQDFYNIAVQLRKNSRFDSIRISGGNTLNCDQALPWYNFLQSQLDEGNTHQLAGSFDNYASFYETVRANGDHATNDELHNVMEAMVGVEYGMQTGIWWGTAELARGEFVKASDGKRLAYAEHRPNWTAASVYRNPEGKIQAFIGSSERQAAATSYHFVSKERDVYYDGHGPQREYLAEIPGGTGYQQGQTNAERMVNITWGEDIQPVINGKYILINRNSGKVMEVSGGSITAGANVQQANYAGAAYQQWNVTPVDARTGGDFSYFSIKAVNSGKSLDVYNWSLDNGGNMAIWDDTNGANQQWYLEYAEDGWFYIRSRHSALCLDVLNASNANAANIIQWEKNGKMNQQWRLIPVSAAVEFVAPSAPDNLVARANAESVRLDWSASPEDDVAGYTIFRSDLEGGPFNTIARNVTSNSFVDNTCTIEGQYFYKIKAVDQSLNSSVYSNEVSATTNGDSALVMNLQFEGNLRDSTINLNHSAAFGEITFVDGKIGTQSIVLNGKDNFLQLPFNVANQKEITVATWVYWNGGTPWQRIFDFGNGESEYMNLTPRMRFAIKNGGTEQRLDASALPVGEWTHVAVTLSLSGARMYLNGELVDESTDITIRPIDFKPILNYIGRAQTTVPFFNGKMDDFRIYNYELSPEEIAKHVSDINTDVPYVKVGKTRLTVYPVPANDILNYNYDTQITRNKEVLRLYNVYGRLIFQEDLQNKQKGEIDVSDLPVGLYILEITNGGKSITKKISINH